MSKTATIVLLTPATESTACGESAVGPTATQASDSPIGCLTRGVKHFSGYNVFSGRDDGADSESFSIESGCPAASRFSAVKP